MTPARKLAVFVGVPLALGLGVRAARVQVPPDESLHTQIPGNVGHIEITVDDYTLAMRPAEDDWVFITGARGRIPAERVAEFLKPLRGLHGTETASPSELGPRNDESGLGSHRFEVRIDAEDLDRRLLGLEVGADVIDGRRAVRQQGRVTAFWADLWPDAQPLPFLDARYWLSAEQPTLCFDDPAVLRVRLGDQERTLTRDPSAQGVSWWIGDIGTGQRVSEQHRQLVEAAAWSLTDVPGGRRVSPPFDAAVEEALSAADLHVHWTPEKAAAQEVTIGVLPNGEAVAREGAVTVVGPSRWRASIAKLLAAE